MTPKTFADFQPWPLEALRDRLCDGDLLWRLCRRKDTDDGRYATREHLLESAFVEVLAERHGVESATRKQPLATSLQLDQITF